MFDVFVFDLFVSRGSSKKKELGSHSSSRMGLGRSSILTHFAKQSKAKQSKAFLKNLEDKYLYKAILHSHPKMD